LRVISGCIKGRKLQTISGQAVRPTADRVKEAMFNILAGKPFSANVLDLFAGSGALGIEAISRGAQKAVFIDRDTKTLSVLRKNIAHCGISEKADIVQWNIERNLYCLKSYAYSFDLVFMDPPYRRNLVSATIKHLMHINCLASGAEMVIEHEPEYQIDTGLPALTLMDTRRYGSTQLTFLAYQPTLSY